jgi:hypothetical protein
MPKQKPKRSERKRGPESDTLKDRGQLSGRGEEGSQGKEAAPRRLAEAGEGPTVKSMKDSQDELARPVRGMITQT